MVLTEDDYLDFLVSVSCRSPLPPMVQEALTSNLLLFVGCSVNDTYMPVLLRALSSHLTISLSRSHWLLPAERGKVRYSKQQRLKMQQYWEGCLNQHGIRVWWIPRKPVQSFTTELKERWDSLQETK